MNLEPSPTGIVKAAVVQFDGSDNTVETQVEATTTVVQTNEADVSNDVDTSADTGNNAGPIAQKNKNKNGKNKRGKPSGILTERLP